MSASTGAAPAASLTQQTPASASSRSPATTASQAELEDQLYDMLDNGSADPSLAHDKLDEIQTFLHEHARDPKTLAQFAAFFEKHALPMQPERLDSLARPIGTGRHVAVEAPPLPLHEPATVFHGFDAGTAAMRRGRGIVWLCAAGFAVLAGLVSFGVSTLFDLRTEVARLHAEVAHTTERLERIRIETEQVRELAEDTHHTAQRIETHADRILQTLDPTH